MIQKYNELYELYIILSSENIKVMNYQVINFLKNKMYYSDYLLEFHNIINLTCYHNKELKYVIVK